jgi:hypothetical protein
MLQAVRAHPRRQSRSACCSPNRAGGACAAPARAPGRPRRSPPSSCAAYAHRMRARFGRRIHAGCLCRSTRSTLTVHASQESGSARRRRHGGRNTCVFMRYAAGAHACSTARAWPGAPASSTRDCCPQGCTSTGWNACMRTRTTPCICRGAHVAHGGHESAPGCARCRRELRGRVIGGLVRRVVGRGRRRGRRGRRPWVLEAAGRVAVLEEQVRRAVDLVGGQVAAARVAQVLRVLAVLAPERRVARAAVGAHLRAPARHARVWRARAASFCRRRARRGAGGNAHSDVSYHRGARGSAPAHSLRARCGCAGSRSAGAAAGRKSAPCRRIPCSAGGRVRPRSAWRGCRAARAPPRRAAP